VGKRSKVAELPEDLKAPQQSLFFDGTRWIPVEPGKTEAAGFGPELSFARRMAEGLKRPVGIIKHSVGGTNLAMQWSPDNPKSLYNQLLAKVKRAQASRRMEIVGFVWVQGGADAKKKEYADAYATNLGNLIRRARQDYRSPDMAVVCERIRKTNTQKKPYMTVVRKAHETCREARYRWIDADDVERGSDNVHYTTAGYVDLGYRCADGMLALLGEAR
jgi:hypothetical protein